MEIILNTSLVREYSGGPLLHLIDWKTTAIRLQIVRTTEAWSDSTGKKGFSYGSVC